MVILYACVGQHNAVLAEHCSLTEGNIPAVSRVLLTKIPENDSKMSYVFDEYILHCLVNQSFIFLCISENNTSRQLNFGFLECLNSLWSQSSPETLFSPIIKETLVSYDKFQSIFCVENEID